MSSFEVQFNQCLYKVTYILESRLSADRRGTKLSPSFIENRWSLDNSSDGDGLSIPRQRRRQSMMMRRSLVRQSMIRYSTDEEQGHCNPVVAYNDVAKIFSVLLGQDFAFVQQAVEDLYRKHSDSVEEMDRARFHDLVQALLACPKVNEGVRKVSDVVDQKAKKRNLFGNSTNASPRNGIRDTVMNSLQEKGSTFSSKYWRCVDAPLDCLSIFWTQSDFFIFKAYYTVAGGEDWCHFENSDYSLLTHFPVHLWYPN